MSPLRQLAVSLVVLAWLVPGSPAPAENRCEPVATFWGEGPAVDVAVSGDLAVVVSGSAIVAFDLSGPLPVRRGALGLRLGIRSLALGGAIAYVGLASGEIVVVDLATPDAPVEIGRAAGAQGIGALALAGPLLYAGDGRLLRVLDVSDPTAPAEIGSVAVHATSPAVSLATVGNLAVVGVRQAGAQVVDVSAPASPVLRGFVAVDGLSEARAASAGSVAYLPGSSAFAAVEVGDPDQPAIVASGAGGGGIAVAGARLVVAGRPGFFVFDVSDPVAPLALGSYLATSEVGAAPALRGKEVLLGAVSRLDWVSILDPTAPLLLASEPMPVHPRSAALDGTLLLVVGRWLGPHVIAHESLQVVDVADPAHPVGLGFLARLGSAQEIVTKDGFAYLGHEWADLSVIDVREPSHPQVVATVGFGSDFAISLDLSGDFLVAGTVTGLQLVDVSSPASPLLAGALATGTVWQVRVDSGRAYAATGGSLVIADVTDGYAPALLGTYTPGAGSIYAVAPLGSGYVALAHELPPPGLDAVEILDLSDPANPEVVAVLDRGDTVTAAALGARGRYLLWRDGRLLTAANVAHPSAPEAAVVSDRHAGGQLVSMRGSGGRVLGVEERDGVTVWRPEHLWCVFLDGFESGDTSAWVPAPVRSAPGTSR